MTQRLPVSACYLLQPLLLLTKYLITLGFLTVLVSKACDVEVSPCLHSCLMYPRAVQVGDGDFFWESNGSAHFPEMAGNVDVQLKQYQEVAICVLLLPII